VTTFDPDIHLWRSATADAARAREVIAWINGGPAPESHVGYPEDPLLLKHYQFGMVLAHVGFLAHDIEMLVARHGT